MKSVVLAFSLLVAILLTGCANLSMPSTDQVVSTVATVAQVNAELVADAAATGIIPADQAVVATAATKVIAAGAKLVAADVHVVATKHAPPHVASEPVASSPATSVPASPAVIVAPVLASAPVMLPPDASAPTATSGSPGKAEGAAALATVGFIGLATLAGLQRKRAGQGGGQ